MSYDPKERTVGWGDVGAGYLLAGAAIAGMLWVLGGETPAPTRLNEGVIEQGGASFDAEADSITWPRDEEPPNRTGVGAAGAAGREAPRSCPSLSKTGARHSSGAG